MEIQGLDRRLLEHPFFAGIDAGAIEVIAGCARNAVFDAGAMVFREGEPAEAFFLIKEGRVAVEVHVPGRGDLVIQTLGAGEVFGWSWLFSPYLWCFDARALERTRAFVFDGRCLRLKCEEDKALGYEMMKRFARIIIDRLQATRLQILDVYGDRP
jgi:CRP-like cAMP-binding protein